MQSNIRLPRFSLEPILKGVPFEENDGFLEDTAMTIPETLYVDHKRLDQYVERITEPLKYDKVPELEVKFGLTDLGVALKQRREGRPLTTYEKIELLRRYLWRENELEHGRLGGRAIFGQVRKVFHEENCRATKVKLPATSPEEIVASRGYREPGYWEEEFLRIGRFRQSEDEALRRAKFAGERRAYETALARARKELLGFNGVNVWISSQTEAVEKVADSLFLFEDFSRGDENTYGAVSSYSALVVIFDDLRSELKKTTLASIDLGEIRNPVAEFHQRFAADPVRALEEKGGIVTVSREVYVLYRIRETVLYPLHGVETAGTFAYPIVIAAER